MACSHKEVLLFFVLILLLFASTGMPLSAQDDNTDNHSTNIYVIAPVAVPVATPGEATKANNNAIEYQSEPEKYSKEAILHDNQLKIEKEWMEMDYSKKAIPLLLCLVPLSLLFTLILRNRVHIRLLQKKGSKPDKIRFSYVSLLLLLPIMFAQWVTVFVNNNGNDYDSIFYDHKTMSPDTEWTVVNDAISKTTIHYGAIKNPVVFVDNHVLQEVSVQELRNVITQGNKTQYPFFAIYPNTGAFFFPNYYVGKEIHVYFPRKFLWGIRPFFSKTGSLVFGIGVYLLWFFLQIFHNGGLYVLTKRTFREKCFLVGITVCSAILAGVFWMSRIPLDITDDGKGYIQLSSYDTIMQTIYSVRTPGYPLFLKFICFFSPLSFHSLIYFQSLIYFLCLSWLLYRLYKKGIPAVLLLIIYALFYDYMSDYIFKTMCETLELSGIAATAAIGLTLSYAVIKNRKTQFVALLILAMLFVSSLVMIKPFPGLILLPGGMLFLDLLATVKLRKNIALTIIIGILTVMLPATYCTIRWHLCGDWNFCSLINYVNGPFALAISTPKSLSSSKLDPSSKQLALEIIDYVKEKKCTGLENWPWCDSKSNLWGATVIRNRLRDKDTIFAFFLEKWNKLDKIQQEKYKHFVVYLNAQCKPLLTVGDPELKDIMLKHYIKNTKELYATSGAAFKRRMGSYYLTKLNPVQSSRYFHFSVSLPLLIFALISFIPNCKKIRYGNWKIVVILIGFATIPLLTFLGQILYCGGTVFEARSEMVMFFSTMLGTILLSMYCIYCCIISLILALRLLYLKYAPEGIKHFFGSVFGRQNSAPANT